MEAPKTLQDAIRHFENFENCKAFMVSLRWPDGIVKCPRCQSEKIFWIEKERVWKCYGKHDHAKFSLKTGTVMEDSPIPIDKWLTALWLIVNCKNGISSCEVARDLGITQKSAWFLDHRIRMSLHNGSIEKASGHVEADETFIGGKARNMHIAERKRRITGTGGKDKTPVMGIVERGGKVRAMVIPNRRKRAIQTEVKKHVEAGSALYTDALLSYEGLEGDYAQEQARDFTVRKQILWESEDATDAEVDAKEIEFITALRSDDPTVGYNRTLKPQSRFKKKPV
jgi:hypothetical protein